MKTKVNKRFLFTVLIIMSLTHMSFGQGGGQNSSPVPPAQLLDIIQSSPDASALGKFGDQQIGLNTGTAIVNIPLYQLKTKNLVLPISLNYSSNGIKVDELSSHVGMSWVLNSGGVISRTVYDKPDLVIPRMAPPPSLNFHPYSSVLNPSASTYNTDPNLLSWLEDIYD